MVGAEVRTAKWPHTPQTRSKKETSDRCAWSAPENWGFAARPSTRDDGGARGAAPPAGSSRGHYRRRNPNNELSKPPVGVPEGTVSASVAMVRPRPSNSPPGRCVLPSNPGLAASCGTPQCETVPPDRVLTIDTRTETRWRIDNARSYPTKPPADHTRCGASGPLAHVRLLARRRAAMDPAATRGLRTGRDAALPAVHLRHWPCQVVHVPLPSLP